MALVYKHTQSHKYCVCMLLACSVGMPSIHGLRRARERQRWRHRGGQRDRNIIRDEARGTTTCDIRNSLRYPKSSTRPHGHSNDRSMMAHMIRHTSRCLSYSSCPSPFRDPTQMIFQQGRIRFRAGRDSNQSRFSLGIGYLTGFLRLYLIISSISGSIAIKYS